MRRSLFVLPAARDDIAAAAAWYDTSRPGLGLTFLNTVEELLGRIAEVPQEFPVVQSEVRRGLVQRFPYRVYFLATEKRVEVLAVIHLHRDPESWKRGK
jgi:plasmid stabilization system protein ParE